MQRSNQRKTRKIVVSAMLAALVCVATMIVKIPSPLKGYINLGDCVVLLAGWLLSPAYGFLAAGLGSALADVFSGYTLYAPVTFAVKGLMAVCSFFLFKIFSKKIGERFSRIVSGLLAEMLMVGGYFLFEGLLYGFGSALVNVPANGVQGGAGLLLGVFLVKLFKKNKIFEF